MSARALALLGAALCLSAPAHSATPSGEKLAAAVAEANRRAGRARPLLFDVALRSGDGVQDAAGTLVSHPTGLARLELRGRDGIERHLLQGSEYAGSLEGRLLASPRPLLPPLFLLQADTGAGLRAALASFGVAVAETALGLADDRDCYVIGGREPRIPGRAAPGRPALWVEVESFEVVAIESRDGVRYRFGPTGSFGEVRIPKWVEITTSEGATSRLEILRAARASAPAAAFGTDWLESAPPPSPAR